MRGYVQEMVIRMHQQNNLFLSKSGEQVYICSFNGQKLVVDEKIAKKSEEEIINYYKSMNVFKNNNGRC